MDTLVVNIELRDANGNAVTSFSEGEEMYFYYSEENKSNVDIYYHSTHCPSFHFTVYDSANNLIGDAIPENYGCTDILKLLSLSPDEKTEDMIHWTFDPSNPILPPGQYTLKFHNQISIPDSDEEKDYDVEIPFTVL